MTQCKAHPEVAIGCAGLGLWLGVASGSDSFVATSGFLRAELDSLATCTSTRCLGACSTDSSAVQLLMGKRCSKLSFATPSSIRGMKSTKESRITLHEGKCPMRHSRKESPPALVL